MFFLKLEGGSWTLVTQRKSRHKYCDINFISFVGKIYNCIKCLGLGGGFMSKVLVTCKNVMCIEYNKGSPDNHII